MHSKHVILNLNEEKMEEIKREKHSKDKNLTKLDDISTESSRKSKYILFFCLRIFI